MAHLMHLVLAKESFLPVPKVSWYATVGGPGAQAPGAVAAQPNGSAIYAVGSAWSAAQVRYQAKL